MSHAKNKVDWCLKKAERKLEEQEKHRGLVKIIPDLDKARDYIKKHSLLAVASKFGYESRN